MHNGINYHRYFVHYSDGIFVNEIMGILEMAREISGLDGKLAARKRADRQTELPENLDLVAHLVWCLMYQNTSEIWSVIAVDRKTSEYPYALALKYNSSCIMLLDWRGCQIEVLVSKHWREISASSVWLRGGAGATGVRPNYSGRPIVLLIRAECPPQNQRVLIFGTFSQPGSTPRGI